MVLPIMNNLAVRFLPLVFVLALVFASAGCSPQAKSARHLGEADKYFAAGEYDKAEVEYKNAFQADATNAAAIGRLGIIYLEQGRVAQAYGFLGRANELNAENPEVRLKLGMLALGTGRPNDAREAATFVLTKNPQHAEAPLLLAESVTKAEEAAAAREFLRALPAPAPTSAPALVALGLIDLRSGNAAAAKTLFDQAQAADPNFAPASAALGRFHLTQRNAALAEPALQKAAELSPLRSPSRLQYAQFLLQAGKVDAAKKSLEELTTKAPDFIPAWIQLAEIAFTQRRFDDAMASLDRVTARYASSPEASLLAARVRLAQGETAKAITVLEAAVARFPQAPLMHHHLGLAYAASNDLPRATASLSQALVLAPTLVQSALALAEVELKQGNTLLAITSLQKIVQENPQSPEAQLLLAQAHRAQGNLEEALKLYRNVDSVQTQNPMPIQQAGMTLLQLNRKTEARQSFTRALTLAPGYLPAIEQLTNLDITEKNLPAARSRIEAELAKTPNAAPLHLLMSRVAFANNDLVAGEAALKKAIELAPDSPAAYTQLAQFYLYSKQDDKAAPYLQSAFEKNPKDTNAAMLLGTLQERLRDFKGAQSTYEKAIAANSSSGALYNNLAYLYAEYLGEPAMGFEAAQKARTLLPNSPQVLDTLGWSLFKQGQYGRAQPFLQDAADKLPDVAEVHYHVGMNLYMLGEEGPARTALERALQVDPQFPGNELARERLALLKLDLTAASAMSDVEKALKRDAADPVALARAGALHERSGKTAEALASYEAILKVSPNNVSATLKTIHLLDARKETAKAFELTKTARRTFPTNQDVAHAFGRLAYKTGDYRSAYNVLQDAARTIGEENPELLLDLASAAYAIGNAPVAETALRRALDSRAITPARAAAARPFLEMVSFSTNPAAGSNAPQAAAAALKADPTDLAALFTLGLASEQKNDAGAARKQYEAALKANPEFALAQKRLAMLYALDAGETAKAHELATKARAAYPNDPEVAKALGIATYRQKNYTRAVTLLEEAVRRLGEDPEVHYFLGAAQLELKRPAEGRKSLERALELQLKGELATDARKRISEN